MLEATSSSHRGTRRGCVGFQNRSLLDTKQFARPQDAARLALLWVPTTSLSVELSALYNRSPFNGVVDQLATSGR